MTVASGSFGSLNGGTGDDVMTGAELDDTLRGGSGNDFMDGGDGNDTVRYNGLDGGPATTSGAFVNLSDDWATFDFNGIQTTVAGGTATDSWGDTDTLASIENARGSDFDDVLVGNAGDNSLDGRAGNDTLVGGAGDDWFRGGDGADTFVFGTDAGDDFIDDFSVGTDSLDLQGVSIDEFAEYDSDDDGFSDGTLVFLSTGTTISLNGVTGVSDANDFLV
jgi:Ca2+-binding RTX toxin-like protein